MPKLANRLEANYMKITTISWLPNLFIFLILIACEAIWFGPIIGKVGFYLDDWSTYSELFNSQQNWLSLIQTALNDPRIVIRPLEAIVFSGFWLAFHDHPFGYHLLNCGFEIAAAFLLYLSLYRLSDSRVFSFVAGLLMLIYPNHDSTHYWAIANTITLSLAFYLYSLWLVIKAVQDKKPICLLFSFLAFSASVFTYESFLPLLAINVICVFALYKKQYKAWGKTLLNSSLALGPYLIALLSAYYYQRIFLAQMSKGFHHSIVFSADHIISVFKEGYSQTLFNIGFASQMLRVHDALADFNINQFCLLVLLLILILGTVFSIDTKEERSPHPLLFMALGFLFIFFSYTIYCISPEYIPKLESIMNRLNTGAAVGASIFISAFFWMITSWYQNSKTKRTLLLATILLPLVVFFVLADWGWAIPWIQSWTFQKYIIGLIKEKRTSFDNNDSIILAHTPRYVMWSPLFDGVWDFEAMLRMYTNKPQIHGNVISDRIVVSHQDIKDISAGYLCGTYPYSHLILLIPNPKKWITVRSAQEFIATNKDYAMGFGLTDKIIDTWQKELYENH